MDGHLDAHLLEWLYMLLRWLHVVTAIAWIGASFYFVWLDNSLEKPTAPDLLGKGVDGELWAVHGGGFYNPQKYLTAPRALPENLHWFYWESYSTWMSGFALFVALYLFNPRTYLVGPGLWIETPQQAVPLALAFLVVGWLVYDGLCRLLGRRDLWVGMGVAAFVALATLLACRLFPGRAAFLIIGAMMATMMSANVLFWIIPGQRKVTAAMRAGLPVDPVHGQKGKQRSVHNTYLTLPVLFAMLSNHYSMLTTHRYNGLILILIMVAGVAFRQYFLLRHKGRQHWAYPAVGAAIVAAVLLWTAPRAPGGPSAVAQATPLNPAGDEVHRIIQDRCRGCHATSPTLIGMAPRGIVFESVEDLDKYAGGIYAQTVQLRAMPLANLTEMTDDERAVIARWYQERRP